MFLEGGRGLLRHPSIREAKFEVFILQTSIDIVDLEEE